MSGGRIGRRGERPYFNYPYRICQDGRYGAFIAVLEKMEEINEVRLKEMRTRFGGIEEILRGRERPIGRSERRATLELIVAIDRENGQ